jgi:hypothetical protein
MRFLAVFFIVVFIATIVHAQDPVSAANDRGSNLIDTTIATINLRAERFNEEISRINGLKALDVPAFQKDTIKKNKQRIKGFLDYLDVYRALSSQLMKATEDSVKALRALMPRNEKEKFLKDFLDAYEMDQKAFDNYTLALTKLFTNVINFLDFLEASHYEIKGNKLLFTSEDESKQSNDLMETVQEVQKKVIEASAKSQRASLDAHKKMQKAYGQVRK